MDFTGHHGGFNQPKLWIQAKMKIEPTILGCFSQNLNLTQVVLEVHLEILGSSAPLCWCLDPQTWGLNIKQQEEGFTNNSRY